MDAARHRCMIYEGAPDQHLPWLASQFAQQLHANNRCVYLNSPDLVAAFSDALNAQGVDVPAEIRQGNLVLSSDQTHLVKGRFDARRMLDMLATLVEASTKDGHPAIWIVGDLTWEFGNQANLTELLEYERGLEDAFQNYPTLHGICQYHQDSLPTSAVHEGLTAHQSVYLNETLFRTNPFYATAPAAALSHIPSDISDLLERFKRNQ